jgi:hypothetical protein
MMTHPYIRITVPVRACASTRTDPNTHTGMSITGNGKLCVLVPTYTPLAVKLLRTGCLLFNALAWPQQLQVKSKGQKQCWMASQHEDAHLMPSFGARHANLA